MRARKLIGIVGKPNVGKSTLFNRLCGSNKALVTPTAGTTRDVIYGPLEWLDSSYDVVDTGGMLGPKAGQLSEEVTQMARSAAAECDVLLMVVDGKHELTQTDAQVARMVRRHPCAMLVVNKADNEADRERLEEDTRLRALGLGKPLALSATHGDGTVQLLDAINEATGGVSQASVGGRKEMRRLLREKAKRRGKGERPEPRSKDPMVRIALLGIPNSGKSTLTNRVVGQERSLVSDVAGTTHDVVDTQITWHDGTPLTVLDTAGINRRAFSREKGLERSSVLWSLRAATRADVNIMLLDAHEGVTPHDKRIAGQVLEGRGSVMIVVNKSDRLINQSDAVRNEYIEGVRSHLRFMPWVPVLFCSALEGHGVTEVIDKAIEVHQQRNQHISTNKLMDLVQRAMMRRPPPTQGHLALKIKYVTQAKVSKPTFVFFCNYPELVHFSYKRFLENAIRQVYPFEGTPLELRFNKKLGKPKRT